MFHYFHWVIALPCSFCILSLPELLTASFLLNLLTKSTLIDPPLCNAADGRERAFSTCSRLIIIPPRLFPPMRNMRQSDLIFEGPTRLRLDLNVCRLIAPPYLISRFFCAAFQSISGSMSGLGRCIASLPPSIFTLPSCILSSRSSARASR